MDGSFHVSHKNVQNLPRNLPECIGDDAQSLLSDELDWSDVRRFMVSQRAAFGAGVGSFLSRACAGAARSSPRRGHERRGLGLLLLDRAAEHRQHLALAPREERLLDHALVRHLHVRDKLVGALVDVVVLLWDVVWVGLEPLALRLLPRRNTLLQLLLLDGALQGHEHAVVVVSIAVVVGVDAFHHLEARALSSFRRRLAEELAHAR
mmetsp:Transcript_58514/g.127085  ORF Transcript_58514/g.127085 Transcript_58514/m.127085 type:complete len:207 (-) Transcript_58514:250-870(-)